MSAWTGGGGRTYDGNVLYHVSSGGTPIRVKDVGRVPVDWEDSGKISPSGGMETDGVDVTSELGQEMDAPSPGEGDGGGGCALVGDLRCPPPEHLRIIYRDKAHYGPVSGGGAAPISSGFKKVVVKRGTWYRRDA